MFCDIEVRHRRSITGAGLQPALGTLVQNPITPPETAFARTELYSRRPPNAPLFAFSAYDCVIIALSSSLKRSRYHLEGQGAAFTVEKLFESAEKFSKDLVEAVRQNPIYRVQEINLQMLQGLGGDTRIAGKLLTLWSGVKEAFDFKAVLSSISTFVTALLLLWLGVKEKPLKAVVISFGVAVGFTCLEALLSYLWSGGKMKWKVRAP
jgi:hypothetical protein